MTERRSSARLASQTSSPMQNNDSPKSAGGMKRKPESGSSPSAKRGKKSVEKEQKTIEETLAINDPEVQSNDTTAKELVSVPEKQPESVQKHVTETGSSDDVPKEEPEPPSLTEERVNGNSKMDDTGLVKPKEETKSSQPGDNSTNHREANQDKLSARHDQSATNGDHPVGPQKNHDDAPSAANGTTAVDAEARINETPSSILEKGIIYFFFRARVNIDEPQDVNDLARSYMIMRPLPHGAKLGEGVIGDDGNCRLLALPKKVLPLSGKDRFMIFVEKSNSTLADLKKDYLSGSDYDTQTAGTRHSPAMTPVAEGVYALTTTGRESHLAYIITIPSELSDVQKDIGLRERGSFVTSVKNPQHAGPANTNLPHGPEYPQEILDEFRSLRWMPLQPKLLDYANTQFLLIGESGGIENATEQLPRDERQDKDTPLEEMEKLENEDEIRVKGLKGDDAVFADLGLSSKEYPKIPSTW